MALSHFRQLPIRANLGRFATLQDTQRRPFTVLFAVPAIAAKLFEATEPDPVATRAIGMLRQSSLGCPVSVMHSRFRANSRTRN